VSKILKWQYSDFLESRRDKLVNLLLSEIIFLKSRSTKIKKYNSKICFDDALKKLEYTLNMLKNNDTELKDKDFDKIIILVYNIIRDITENLEE